MIPASTATRWKWCLITSLAMVLLSLIPQIHLWVISGRQWNGVFVSAHGDEPQYSAYVNALMNGRPRKNDPFGGVDSSPAAPLPESIFSIQFIPAYAIALPARLLRVSASSSFIVLIAVAAALGSLAVFWLINSVTQNPSLAAAGTVFVLCLGALAGGHGLLGILIRADLSIPSLPFLRRYQPAAAFPLFFVLQTLSWKALTRSTRMSRYIQSGLAACSFAVLVFSYLYLWTAALAWLIAVALLWLFLRNGERRKTIVVLTIFAAIAGSALALWAYLISRRAEALDQQQVLFATHSLDLLHVPEILGLGILIALTMAVIHKRISLRDPRVLFVASLAILPLVVFNQQVVTGKAMQVYHFDAFVVNYSSLVALVLTFPLLRPVFSTRLMVWVISISFVVGIIEVALPAKLAFVPAALAKDRAVPILERLRELSKQDGTLVGLRTQGRASTLVFSPNVSLIAMLPTWSSQGALLDISGVDCGTATRADRKEFFFMHLYYSSVEKEELRQLLDKKEQFATAMIFGHERLFPALSSQFSPIQPNEIDREVQAYEAFKNSFSREESLKRPITYAVIPVEGSFDFTNLERWYECDGGERVGDYVLYRLKQR